jgi:hypothetical protein
MTRRSAADIFHDIENRGALVLLAMCADLFEIAVASVGNSAPATTNFMTGRFVAAPSES